jgi:serine/threonine-protein kinase
MSPEQARGEVIDARSDLFSLGSLLYALATGRPPYRAESPLAVLRKISDSRPKPIHQIKESIPRWFDEMVGKLMTGDPAKRTASAEDAAVMLREGCAHVRNPAMHALPKVVRTNRFRRLTFTLPLMASVCLAVPIVAVAPGWFNGFNGGRTIQSGIREEPQASSSGSPAADVTVVAESTKSFDWMGTEVQSELASIDRTLANLEETLLMSTATDSPSPGYLGPAYLGPERESFSSENPLQ